MNRDDEEKAFWDDVRVFARMVQQPQPPSRGAVVALWAASIVGLMAIVFVLTWLVTR